MFEKQYLIRYQKWGESGEIEEHECLFCPLSTSMDPDRDAVEKALELDAYELFEVRRIRLPYLRKHLLEMQEAKLRGW